MNRFKTVFIALLSCVLLSSSQAAHAEHEGLDIRILNAKKILSEYGDTIPRKTLEEANVIIVFPQFIKAGFFYAGRFGLGVVLTRDPESGKWSAPAFMRISGGSFGYQAGAQNTELILVGRDGYTFDKFRGGPAVSGSASAAFGPWGVHSELGSGWQFNSKMHWFAKNTGLFAAVAMEGTAMSYDEGANRAYYGDGVLARDVLFGKKIQPSYTGQMLIDELNRIENRIDPDLAKTTITVEVPEDKLGSANKYSNQTAYRQPTAPVTANPNTNNLVAYKQPNGSVIYYQAPPAANANKSSLPQSTY
ncbi:MAG: lipid-binding SYLF domain-containing protein [Candidatus Omnitrophica bacterium]|nr:lipid-binding SYLF domain-containing protein [Candidatus Omnitrophota bacterium]